MFESNNNNNDHENIIFSKQEPTYTNNHIKDMIRYDTNKYSKSFGCSYLHNKHYEIKERNEYIYKLRDELGDYNIYICNIYNITLDLYRNIIYYKYNM